MSQNLVCPPFPLMTACTRAGLNKNLMTHVICYHDLTLFQRTSCDDPECFLSLVHH